MKGRMVKNCMGSADVFRNHDFISIASTSYIQVIYDMKTWFPLDVHDDFLGGEILKACQKTHEYSIAHEERGEVYPTNYKDWVVATKMKFKYKTERAMFGKMEHCQVERCLDKIIIVPLVHMKLKAWGRRNSDVIKDVVLTRKPSLAEIGKSIKSVLETHWEFY